MNVRLFSAAALLFAAAGVMAQTTWKIDKAHSSVGFAVSHMVISEVAGSFTDFDATVTSGRDDFADASIEAIIKSASINTQNERRDNHLRSDDFLDAVKFPEIRFTSTRLDTAGPNLFKLTGDLTIRGVTKQVVLDLRYKGQINTGQMTKAAFKATGTIDRFEFGVRWDQALDDGAMVVGKNVDITLLMECNKQTPEGQLK